ncbi:hypothetical protein Adi01nite_48340 [Amorphoplanes digitatis]|nr:hypothetical protein Adi01nite_48340 [Actinoplanes digitatis]
MAAADPAGPEDESVPAGTVHSPVRRAALRVALAIAIPLLVGLVVATEGPNAGGTVRWGASASPAPPAAEPTSAAPGSASPATVAPNPFRTVPQDLSGPPTRLRVRSIGIDTALETLRLGTGGELQPPRDYDRAGWYADGTAPGDLGPAVLAGHVDSKRGPAIFFRLRELRPGDRIEVVRGGRTLSFTVTTTAWYPKTAFPSEKVYGPTPDRQLRLITCGGVFDRSLRSYRDNLVVYAAAG